VHSLKDFNIIKFIVYSSKPNYITATAFFTFNSSIKFISTTMNNTSEKQLDSDTKPITYHLEEKVELAATHNGDYSGAVAKTDPVEIRLVKKLDWRIMPTLWAMYFLNYVCGT
jgi:hypothetical protein